MKRFIAAGALVVSVTLSSVSLGRGLIESQAELDAIDRAHAATDNIREHFKKALSAALAKKGTAGALPDCQIEGPEAQGQILTVGRTSHRLRNPKNAPKAWVKPYLEKFASGNPKDIPPHVLVNLEGGKYGYLEPVFVEPVCLACHGSGLDPEVTSVLAKDYPKDQATGFKVGDFRGLLWLEMKPASNVVPSRTTDYEPLTILAKNCAGCHQQQDRPGALFLNRERLSERQTLELMIGLLEKGAMPPAHSKFAKTRDGKRLLKWLKGQLAGTRQ